MKRTLITFITLLGALSWGNIVFSMECHDEDAHAAEVKSAEKMTMDHNMPTDTYSHQMVVDGVRGEFEVMSLESMNMKDPDGASHHIMVKLFHDEMDHQIKEAVGKIKVIGPDEKDQVAELKNYSGIFAANFTFGQAGKYGVICLVKIGEDKHVFKFWYPHGM